MKSLFFAVAAVASLAALPVSAAVITASLDASAMNTGQLNTVAITPVSLGAGDTLDLTINFTNGPMRVGNGSSLWIGLLTNENAATLNSTATTFVLGGSANMVGSVSGTQDNSFAHLGNFFGGFASGAGDLSFAGLRQTLLINSSDLQGTRSYDRALFFFNEGPTGIGVVPEPSSWAMLIAGFGLVGAVARRRRPVAA
jgi:hypothetical protein